MDKFIAHILVVDDDDGIRSLVKKYFKNMNFFFLTMPFLICSSLIISIFTFNISKFIYNLGRIRGFFIIHFNIHIALDRMSFTSFFINFPTY